MLVLKGSAAARLGRGDVPYHGFLLAAAFCKRPPVRCSLAPYLIPEHTTLELECIDRMYLNVYVSILRTGAGTALQKRPLRPRAAPGLCHAGEHLASGSC